MRVKILVGLVGAWVWAGGAGVLGQTLSYLDLVQRLTDLEGLAVLPEPGEQCAQWSSYDRQSRYDDATEKYVAWDANGDGEGHLGQDGDRIVMAEMRGPGCIWRIWSAAPKEGHVRVYLDDAPEPAIDLPFRRYFDRTAEPFTQPALVHTVASGWNNYTPIPYQKSCRIVADPGWGQYYQWVYSTFPPRVRLPTFRQTLEAAERAALEAANRRLEVSGPFLPPTPGEQVEQRDLVIHAGAECVIQRTTGPAALRTLRLKFDPPVGPTDRQLLRELTLQIRWDEEEAPSVWAPLGDFFGTAAGANPYRSLPSGLTEDGWWYCHWYMPFTRKYDLRLVNQGRVDRRLHFEWVTAPIRGDLTRMGRFHAKWHRDALLPKEPERAIDWTLLRTEGTGRYVGVLLHVWNPRGGWWGEGDEKFHVDGERFPSTFGTGSEDYFGYAWGDATLFQNAYHSQTLAMDNRGHVSINRWHVSDNVPFQRSFAAYLEKYLSNQRPTLYACTVYWYVSPDGIDPYPPRPLDERVGYWDEAQLQGRGANVRRNEAIGAGPSAALHPSAP